ncbi:aminotransferase class I/II-fold pyridoxal phosphate-dependent enzyme [Roseibium sp. MMSF_3412]|uniref:aminotransferase class I/II-fold pyridoxal phosphate-dependent enzyme n=1 Tax=Roseibium sp. MMSF_3412 TaxID=3046712 RepID=UPI00273D1BA1|nr:aminotransferase class I/II-fold pyridoxal phosphate-dependent enzyme [Roseibium sp. MMSF_3412]
MTVTATTPRPMRDFGLEVFFSRWEFTARHHMTASDLESMSLSELLALASDEDRSAFENLWLGYTETWGAPALRQEIAGTYDKLSESNILCLAGAGEGLYAVPHVLLTRDDHAIVPTPNYQGSETIPLSICDVTGVPMDYTPSSGSNGSQGGWHLDLDRLKDAIRPNTKLISLNFPHNPTGFLLPREELEALVSLARAHGIYILSDEVYRGVELDETKRMPQIADHYERGISLNVMSKAYGLPGIRIGWIASQDRDLLQKAERFKHYLSICNSGPSEILALIALKARQKILARNRAIMMENAAALERLFAAYPDLFEWQRPMGGCVAFPRYLGPDGVETFTRKLVEESGVLLLPSSIYSSELGTTPQDHFRIGIGRAAVFRDGLKAMEQHLDKTYPEFRT